MSSPTPAWNARTSAYTSTRLQVDRTSASATCGLATADAVERGQPLGADRGALEQRDRRRPVRQAHDDQAHPTASRAARAGASSCLRCWWNARICSSLARSTRRTSTCSGTRSGTGAKLRTLDTPAATSRSQTSCAAPAGVATTPMQTPVSADDPLQVGERVHGQPADHLAGALRGGVDQRRDAEAAAGEAAVVGQRVPEVADADDDDRPVLGQPQLAGDLVHEVADVVADAAGAVRAQVRQVLAQLGRVDARGLGELLGGHRRGAVLVEGDQGAVVEREPGDGGLGDSAPAHVRARLAAAALRTRHGGLPSHSDDWTTTGLQGPGPGVTARSLRPYGLVNGRTKSTTSASGY